MRIAGEDELIIQRESFLSVITQVSNSGNQATEMGREIN